MSGTHTRPGQTDWTGENGAHVLVECADGGVGWAAGRVLERRGYAVATCDGPVKPGGCPLVSGGRCELVEEADLVVHALNPDVPEHAEVLGALRARHAETPVLAEVSHPHLERHAELLEGCDRVAYPMTRRSLLWAVSRVLRDRSR